MKNGYTPREFAHSIAVDALLLAIRNTSGELDGLTPSERSKAIEQLSKLRVQLADKAHLDLVSVE